MKIKSLLLTVLIVGFISVNSFGQKQEFKISLAEWSLHRALWNGKTITNLDFPRIAKKTYDLDAVELFPHSLKEKGKIRLTSRH